MPKKRGTSKTPRQFTAEWQKSGTTQLNDVYNEILEGKRLDCRIDSQLTSVAARALITITSRPKATRYAPPNGYYINWSLTSLAGDRLLTRPLALGGAVNIEGTPTPDTPYFGDESIGLIKPYRDKIFRGGPLKVILPHTETGSGGRQFDFGRVAGITIIVAGEETYPVWEPFNI